jgi:hypothetical protein
MGYREVRIYGGEFPTPDQILSGDPTSPPFPKEVWLQQVQPGKFAVRYKDFKTGLARSPDGRHVRSSEICRVFGDLEEASANSREVAKKHWAVVCVVYDHTGAQIGRISNNKGVNKYAAIVYAGILFWGCIYAFAGMGVLWVLYRIALFAVRLWRPGYEPIPFPSLHWIGWLAFAAAGLLIMIAVWFLRIRFVASQRVKKVESSFTPEEMKRFEELNTLHGSADPAQRERFLKLAKEYQQRVQEALKK